MKNSTYFYATAFFGIGLLFSVQKSENLTQEITFIEAINKGYITCNSNSTGDYSGKSVKLNITNKTPNSLIIILSPGTLFYPSDSGEQTLITVVEQLISLAPKEKKSDFVYAYCNELDDRSPTNSTVFTIGKNKNPKFDSLFFFMKPLKIPESEYQDIVWSISDNSSVSSVKSDSKDLKELRKYLFKITKQEEADYTSEFLVQINERGYIVKTIYQINGSLELTSDKTKWLHQEVYNESGKMKFKSMQAFEIPQGKSDYTFNIRVKGWEKGTYTMKLKYGSEEVEKYTFKV